MFIDTHAHLYLEHFKEDIDFVVELTRESGVEHVYLPNVDSETTGELLNLVECYPDMMHPMMGIHPCSIKENYLDELRHAEEELGKGNYIAIGEIGIDLYWEKTFHKEQKKAFERQIEWSRDLGLPFVIHSRESLDETISTVEKLQKGDLKGIFHCFNGTEEQGRRIEDQGFFIGIGGVLTYKNSGVRENIVNLSLDFMVLETDAPYLSPTPFRGKRNQSNYIPIIAEQLAIVKEVDLKTIADITTKNAIEVFGTPN